jgi:hypothetical protein
MDDIAETERGGARRGGHSSPDHPQAPRNKADLLTRGVGQIRASKVGQIKLTNRWVPLADQEPIGGDAQGGVMVKTAPTPLHNGLVPTPA